MHASLRFGASTALLFPLLLGSPQDDSPIVDGPLGQRADAYLTLLEGVGFSGVVGILEGGETVLLKGYGLADREAGKPVTTDTVFSTGSITKQFTAAAILLLEQEGQLSVEDSIADHFDGVPPDKAEITLHHLLTHSSGLASGFGGDWDLEATAPWILARALDNPLRTAPGTRFHYSNAGYSLLGMIVERVSGQGYEDFLQEHLFAPAGMESTGYLAPAFGDRIAIGYDQGRRWGTVLARPLLSDGPCWNLRANGGIHSTAGDMLRWHLALEGDALLTQASKDKLYAPHMDEGGGQTFYAYGWSVRDLPGARRRIAHNGGNGILFADFLRYPDEDLAIFVATNVAQDFSPVTRSLRRVVFDEPQELPPATLALEPGFVARYTGRYPLDDESTFVLEERPAGLYLVGEGAGAAEILGGDARSMDLRQRSAEVVVGLIEGDFQAFHRWNDSDRPPEDTEDSLAGLRASLLDTHGEFVELGAVAAQARGDDARSFVEARFTDGIAYVILGWSQGRIGLLDVSVEPPWPAAGELRLFPFTPEEFGTFSMDSSSTGPGGTFRVRFELSADGRAESLTIDAELGPLTAYRD